MSSWLHIFTAHSYPTLKSLLMWNLFPILVIILFISVGSLRVKQYNNFSKAAYLAQFMFISDLKILKYNWLAMTGAQKLDGKEWKTDKLGKVALSSTNPAFHMHFWKLSQRCWWATSEISWPLSRICTALEMWKALCPEIFWDSCEEKTALLQAQHQCLLRFVHLHVWLMLQEHMLNWHNRPYIHGSSAKSDMPWKVLDRVSMASLEQWDLHGDLIWFRCMFNKFPVVDFMT